MLGVRAGQTLAIREWAALWELGERYRSGEGVLLFLYPPSKLGLTSPAMGPWGRFRIGPDGQVVIDPRRIGVPARRPEWEAGYRERRVSALMTLSVSCGRRKKSKQMPTSTSSSRAKIADGGRSCSLL
jgi:hypothetical protein